MSGSTAQNLTGDPAGTRPVAAGIQVNRTLLVGRFVGIHVHIVDLTRFVPGRQVWKFGKLAGIAVRRVVLVRLSKDAGLLDYRVMP